MNNIIIGNTSQLSYFFPKEYIKISSRNINFYKLEKKYKNVYLTFAEQRTFNKILSEKDFLDVNVVYTSELIEYFSKIAEKVIVYGTAELWNHHNGEIDLNTKIDYKYSPYIKSKEILYETILNKRLKNQWNNVIIIHPFNFNSLLRKEGFLFYKVYDSLLNNKINNVGNLNINRDIIHVDYLVNKSLTCTNDCIVGSGKLINVENFIYQVFNEFNKHYNDFLIQDKTHYSYHMNNEFWLKTDDIYIDLLQDTVSELKNNLNNGKKI
jgi:nucleoside-diphosphate-sugar epimerase